MTKRNARGGKLTASVCLVLAALAFASCGPQPAPKKEEPVPARETP